MNPANPAIPNTLNPDTLHLGTLNPDAPHAQPQAGTLLTPAGPPSEPSPCAQPSSTAGRAVAAATPGTPLALQVSALSDVGCVRTNNEDSFHYDQALGVYVVCDGMGGMASGEVASALAADIFVHTFAASARSGIPVGTRMLHAIEAANHAVYEQGQYPPHKGMGTTLVAVAIDRDKSTGATPSDKLIIGNVGDSRAYILDSGRCIQLTVDHSYLNELIRNGTLTLENAHAADLNGMESVITRAIGAASAVQPDFFSVDLTPTLQLLLVSDGLTRYVSSDEIATVLAATTFDTACASLIHLAKERGGHDNITCLLLRPIPATPIAATPGLGDAVSLPMPLS